MSLESSSIKCTHGLGFRCKICWARLMDADKLESWSFSAGQRMPDYLFERLDKSINELTEEVLK